MIQTIRKPVSISDENRKIITPHGISKSRYLYLEVPVGSEILAAFRQQWCRGACQISELRDQAKYQIGWLRITWKWKEAIFYNETGPYCPFCNSLMGLRSICYKHAFKCENHQVTPFAHVPKTTASWSLGLDRNIRMEQTTKSYSQYLDYERMGRSLNGFLFT